MVDLSTTYLKLKLKNPLVASASPLSRTLEPLQELEKAGIAAVVMHSLFEEEIIHESLELDHYLSYGQDISAESPSHALTASLPVAGSPMPARCRMPARMPWS